MMRNFLLCLLAIGVVLVVVLNVTSIARVIQSEANMLSATSSSFASPVADMTLQTALDKEKLINRELKDRIKELEEKLSQSLSGAEATAEGQGGNGNSPINVPCEKSEANKNDGSNEQQSAQGASISADPNALLPTQSVVRSEMCSVLPPVIPSALHVWNSYLSRVVKASQHERDHHFKLHDFTSELLHLISPDKIDRSIVGIPHHWTNVKRVLTKVWERYKYITTKEGPEKPLVKILVMGGSLIVGVNCRRIVKDYNLGILLPNRLCTWTHRLEIFLNKMLMADVFQVEKVALGGTNTETGHVLLEQDFLPDEAKNADILINAYSTNDMHILTVLEARQSGVTLRDKVMEMTQNFVRTAMKEGDCAPLLLHMDDYLGNEQREILTTIELSQAVQTLSAYYGFTAMSYANVVRDIVYGDTKEGWFSPSGWYEEGVMVREIHPGMGMHIVTSWVTAYNMLNLALTYCTIEPFLDESTPVDDSKEVPYEKIAGLPRLRRQVKIAEKPHGRPRGLPPPLTASLSLENVTALWKRAPPVQTVSTKESCPNNTEAKCPLSWISGLTKTGLNETIANRIFVEEAFSNVGWMVNKDGGKVGISPDGPGSPKKLQLVVPQVKHDITGVTLFYMKSYGTKWADSRIRMTVSSRTGDGAFVPARPPDELVGFHGKNTSESYTHRLQQLGGLTTGKDILVEMELIGGTTFKIMGLAVCK